MTRTTADAQEVARPIAMGLVDLKAALLPSAILASFLATWVGVLLAFDFATRHLVI